MIPALAAMTAATLNAVAAMLQRRAISRLDVRAGSLAVALLRNPAWLVGLALEGASDVAYFVALASPNAELSILQPIMSGRIALTMLLGVAVLSERLSATEWAGTGLMLLGLAAALLAGGARGAVAVPSGPVASSLVLVAACLALIILVWASRSVRAHPMLLSAAAGLCFSVSIVSARFVGASLALSDHSTVGDFMVAVIPMPAFWLLPAGSLGGFAILQHAYRGGRIAVTAPSVGLVATVLPILAGWVLLDERPRAWSGVSVVALVLGMVLVIRDRRRGGGERRPFP